MMQALESAMKWDWKLIGSFCTIITLAFIVISFFYHNYRQKSHKLKLSITKSCLNGTELYVEFTLENKSINNIQLTEVKLDFLSTNNELTHTASSLGNVLLQRRLGILYVGGCEIYSDRRRAAGPSKMNEDIDKYILHIYSKHSKKPVSKSGKICREQKQD